MAGYIREQLSIPSEFVGGLSWRGPCHPLENRTAQLGWICGLPYVRLADRYEPPIVELLVAPVMKDERYGKRPIYFSDVVVHRHSPFQTFADLRGASWAYNNVESQSGYNITRYHLATLGETSGFFGQAVATGAHRLSLRWVLNRKVDASAIDSTVLDWELHHHPEIGAHLRVIETLGPTPIPPWVILRSVPREIRQRLRRLFLEMHLHEEGRAILAKGFLSHFVEVRDEDYNPIRAMAQQAEAVTFP